MARISNFLVGQSYKAIVTDIDSIEPVGDGSFKIEFKAYVFCSGRECGWNNFKTVFTELGMQVSVAPARIVGCTAGLVSIIAVPLEVPLTLPSLP